MRAILLILIVAVLAVILAVASGFLHLNLTQGARAPSVAVHDGAVTTKAGQAPSFEVETGSVAVGTQQKDVTLPRVKLPVPSIHVNRPRDTNAQQPASNAAQ